MPRNRSVEHWFLCLTNHLTAFQIHSSFHAKLKKNAAPKVSQPVFSWELKIYLYWNKYRLSSPAEPMLPVCPGQEGRQEQSWEAMLWTSPCSTPGSAHLCPDQGFAAFFPLLLSPSKTTLWRLIFLSDSAGVWTLQEKGLWFFFRWSY